LHNKIFSFCSLFYEPDEEGEGTLQAGWFGPEKGVKFRVRKFVKEAARGGYKLFLASLFH
jgi:hypothetical protein